MYRRTVDYYIYENWTHNKIVIHTDICCCCNYGKGRNTRSSVKNGIWIGPLKNKQDADFVASKLRRKTILKCTRCL